MAKTPAAKKPAKAASTSTVIAKRLNGVLEITFNRPEVMNAINMQMAGELVDAMTEAENDRKIHAVILQGNERAFCAGADLGSTFKDTPKARYDNYRSRFHARDTRYAFNYINTYTKPVISAVEGFCLGGGLEMAMFGDFIIAGEKAQFGLPETRWSLIPGAGGTQNLQRYVGKAMAKEMIWTARRITAQEAKEFRLVNHVVPAGKALDKAREIAQAIAQNGPLAVMITKQSINRGAELPLHYGVLQEGDLSYLLTWSEDRAEGLDAFANRRPPKYKGE